MAAGRAGPLLCTRFSSSNPLHNSNSDALPSLHRSAMAPPSPPLAPLVLSARNVCSSVFNPQGRVDFPPMENEDEFPDIGPAPSPTKGRINIVVTKEQIRQLDLTPAHSVLSKYVHQIGDNTTPPLQDPKELLECTVGFQIDYKLDDPLDPRELSELPDVRLWFVRLDASYPWLPVVLDWRGGELARYAAMLVPHQMSRKLGIVFNPEALELFVMNKLFTVHSWLKSRNIGKPELKASDMTRMLGFSIDDILYELIEKNPLT